MFDNPVYRATVVYSSSTTGEIKVRVPVLAGADSLIPISYIGRSSNNGVWEVPSVGTQIVVTADDGNLTNVFWIQTNPVSLTTINTDIADLETALSAKAPLASPTFTGTVSLPTSTSIGSVSSAELGYVDGVTSSIQTQLNSKLTATTANTSGRNRIINGSFDIWQRGVGPFTNSNEHNADRWVAVAASGQTLSVTRQTFTPGNPISGYEPAYYARIAWSGTPSGTFWFTQRVEDVRTFAGQEVVLSFWAKASSSTSVFSPTIEQNFGTGGSSLVTTGGSAITLTTSWQRFSSVITLPSISGKTIGTNSYLDVRPFNAGSSVNGINIDIWGVQLEAGSVATPFEFEDYGTILAKCQRYLYIQTGSKYFATAIATDSTNAQAIIPMPVTMRIAPTASINTLRVFDGVASIASITSVSDGSSTPYVAHVYFVSSGMTAFRNYFIIHNGSTSYLALSAEL